MNDYNEEIPFEDICKILIEEEILFLNDIQHFIKKEKLISLIDTEKSLEVFGEYYFKKITNYLKNPKFDYFIFVSQFDLKFSLELGMDMEDIYMGIELDEDFNIIDYLNIFFFGDFDEDDL